MELCISKHVILYIKYIVSNIGKEGRVGTCQHILLSLLNTLYLKMIINWPASLIRIKLFIVVLEDKSLTNNLEINENKQKIIEAKTSTIKSSYDFY